MFTNSLNPSESLDQNEPHIGSKVEHKVEEHSIMDRSHGNDEVVTKGYDYNSDFFSSHNSLHCHVITTI